MCQILQLIHGENIAARRICSEGNEISGCPVMHVRVGCVRVCVCVYNGYTITRKYLSVFLTNIYLKPTNQASTGAYTSGLLLHPIELFLIPTSVPRLVYQKPLHVLSCLWDGAYKQSLEQFYQVLIIYFKIFF